MVRSHVGNDSVPQATCAMHGGPLAVSHHVRRASSADCDLSQLPAIEALHAKAITSGRQARATSPWLSPSFMRAKHVPTSHARCARPCCQFVAHSDVIGKQHVASGCGIASLQLLPHRDRIRYPSANLNSSVCCLLQDDPDSNDVNHKAEAGGYKGHCNESRALPACMACCAGRHKDGAKDGQFSK
jgi:hypothetical protein